MVITFSIVLILAVVIGAMFAQTLLKNATQQLHLFFAFSGSFLLGLTISHLIPAILQTNLPNISSFILLGFLLQILLESASQGIEHGHAHTHSHEHSHFAFPLVVGLSLHAILEGIPMSFYRDNSNDYSWHWGIIIHKIPEAMALMTVLMCSQKSVAKRWYLIGLFAMLSPIGLWLGKWFINDYYNILQYLVAISAGSFLHISAMILFETDKQHQHHLEIKKIGIIAIGIILSIII